MKTIVIVHKFSTILLFASVLATNAKGLYCKKVMWVWNPRYYTSAIQGIEWVLTLAKNICNVLLMLEYSMGCHLKNLLAFNNCMFFRFVILGPCIYGFVFSDVGKKKWIKELRNIKINCLLLLILYVSPWHAI